MRWIYWKFNTSFGNTWLKFLFRGWVRKNNNLWFFTDTINYHQMWFLFLRKMRNSETKYKCQIRAGWLKLFVLLLDLAMSTWYSGQCTLLYTQARQHDCNAFCSRLLGPEREREREREREENKDTNDLSLLLSVCWTLWGARGLGFQVPCYWSTVLWHQMFISNSQENKKDLQDGTDSFTLWSPSCLKVNCHQAGRADSRLVVALVRNFFQRHLQQQLLCKAQFITNCYFKPKENAFRTKWSPSSTIYLTGEMQIFLLHTERS